MSTEELLDNTLASKPSPQYRRTFWMLIAIVTIIPFLLGVFIITGLGRTIETAILIVGGACLIAPTFLMIFSRILFLYPTQIALSQDNMVIFIEKKKMIVPYDSIIRFFFNLYSYNHKGSPQPRWILEYKTKLFRKQIDLTEDNAKLLAKYLDEKEITYTWSERAKKRWEDDVKRKQNVT